MNVKMVSLLVLGLLVVSVLPQAFACSPWDSDLDNLRHRCDDLDQKIHDFDGCKNDCQKQINDLQKQINDLEQQIDDLQARVNSLQTQTSTEITEITNRLTQLENEYNNIQQLYVTVTNIQNEIMDIQNTITNMNITQVTIVNKYYETRNYDSDITNINTHITQLTTYINSINNNTELRESLLNSTIIALQKSFNTLSSKVDTNNQNVLNIISSLHTEILTQLTTQIQTVDIKHTNTEQQLQSEIDQLNKNLLNENTIELTDYSNLSTRIGNLEQTLLNQFILIMILFIAFMLSTIFCLYEFWKLHKLTLKKV